MVECVPFVWEGPPAGWVAAQLSQCCPSLCVEQAGSPPCTHSGGSALFTAHAQKDGECFPKLQPNQNVVPSQPTVNLTSSLILQAPNSLPHYCTLSTPGV